jgi:hypothetical protein
MTVESIERMTTWFKLHPLILLAIILWVLFWKGIALWKAAGLRQKYWFIALLVLNTMGILEIIYYFFVARKYEVQVVDKR